MIAHDKNGDIDKGIDMETYADADILSAQIPVVYCPKCREIRGETEMIESRPECIHCKSD